MSKNGLLIDYDWCTGCHSCEVACQMLKGLPTDQFGIKLTEVGPWEIEEGNWQLCYVPVPTKQCDLCADRTARGKLPSCVKHCQARCMEFGAVEELAQKLAAKPRQVLFSVE